MKQDNIRKVWAKLEPSPELSEKIGGMIDAADIEAPKLRRERTAAVRRSMTKRVRTLAVCAATLVLLAVSATAFGVMSGLIYLPGAGMVDGDGTLVIRESDIGDLEGLVAYKTAAAVDFGDYSIDNVTYTDFEGERSYAVWTQIDYDVMELSRGSEGIPVSDRVIDDLTLTLPDGQELLPVSSRYGYDGYIVYTYEAEQLDTKLTVSSASKALSVGVELFEVTDAGYSYMEYPTDQGITLRIYPVNEEFSEYELSFIDGAISDGLDEYVDLMQLQHPTRESVKFITEDGDELLMEEWHARTSSRTGNWGSSTYYVDIEGSAYNSHRKEDGYYHWIEIEDPAGSQVVGVEVDSVKLVYSMTRSDANRILLPMPEDGERIDGEFVVFDEAGFTVKLTGYERNGDTVTVYADAGNGGDAVDYVATDVVDDWSFEVPYSGSSPISKAYASLRILVHDGYSGGSQTIWEPTEDGQWKLTLETDGFESSRGEPELGDTIQIEVQYLTCVYEGDWSISYK